MEKSEWKESKYVDTNFHMDDYKSLLGIRFLIKNIVVSWKSSNRKTTMDSNIESEYIAASEAAKEAEWMLKFIAELEVVPSIDEPISIYYDDNGAIA